MIIEKNIYEKRRADLRCALQKQFPSFLGPIVVAAGFEDSRYPFRQDSSFYYLTGLEEPGVVLVMSPEGKNILYAPVYAYKRELWTNSRVYNKQGLNQLGIDDIKPLGQICAEGVSLFLTADEYCYLIQDLQQATSVCVIQEGREHKALFSRWGIADKAISGFSLVSRMRRKKDRQEIEQIYTAIDGTMAAQEAAAHVIAPEQYEYQVQAGVEFIFTQSGCRTAFPTIVASGSRATKLHYTDNNKPMKNGELVVVDCGTEYQHYCADISRTYPVSGIFNKRQKDLYTLVLKTQDHIARLARPGYYLFNKDVPEKSLHHCAVKFLQEQGYDTFFTHTVGHFLGLDVHDVGLRAEPLQEGDVFTIEPGIYIPHEGIGIRIEDDYWMTYDGAECLSQELAREPEEIEELMQQRGEQEEEEDDNY